MNYAAIKFDMITDIQCSPALYNFLWCLIKGNSWVSCLKSEEEENGKWLGESWGLCLDSLSMHTGNGVPAFIFRWQLLSCKQGPLQNKSGGVFPDIALLN